MQRAVKLKYFRFQQVFQNGASASAPDATLGDMIHYVNRDSFTPLGSRVVKQGVSINTGNGSLVNQQYMANNDYKMNNILKIDVTPYLYKEYYYPDNTNTPTNDMTIMVFEGVNADGSAGCPTIGPISFRFLCKFSILIFN